MKRIDKIISEQTHYTRREIKKLIANGLVLANGERVQKPETKYDETALELSVAGKSVKIQRHVYLLLHKPQGYISTTEDPTGKSVLELVDEQYKNRALFPAGRLDKDTTGLMLITDDGEFAHNILSPRKHIKKTYEVLLDSPLQQGMEEAFLQGIELKDSTCKPALLIPTGTHSALVTLTEGRYHQIKRMFGCFGAKVIKLHRTAMGELTLPEDLYEGTCRPATETELLMLQGKTAQL